MERRSNGFGGNSLQNEPNKSKHTLAVFIHFNRQANCRFTTPLVFAQTSRDDTVQHTYLYNTHFAKKNEKIYLLHVSINTIYTRHFSVTLTLIGAPRSPVTRSSCSVINENHDDARLVPNISICHV